MTSPPPPSPLFPYTTLFRSNGYDIRTVQELLGHKEVSTTMIYTHVLNKPGLAIRSPLDEERPSRGNRLVSELDRKSTRLNSSHQIISYAVFCLKKKNKTLTL